MPGGGSSTRPPKSSQRTPSSRHTLHDLADRLPLGRRAVERSLARDDEVGRASLAREVDPLEHDGRTRHELALRATRAPRRGHRPRPRRAARRTGRAPTSPASRASSSSTCSGVAPFCGPNARAAPRSPSSGLRTSQRTCRSRPLSDSPTTSSNPAPPSTVAVSPSPTRIGPERLASDRHEQLAKAATRGLERVELARPEPAQPDHLGRLDDRRPILEDEVARLDRRGRADPKQALSATRRRGSLRRPPPCPRRRRRREARPPRGRRRASRPPGPSPPRPRTGRPCS